jgi:hypothetical protein
MISNRIEEMGLSETDATVNEKGVEILCREVGDGKACSIGKLIARSDHEILKGVLWIEHRLDGGSGLDLAHVAALREGLGLGGFLCADSNLEVTRLLGKESEGILQVMGVMLIDPIPKESIWNLEFHLFIMLRDEVDWLDPDIEVLLPYPFFQRVGNLRPEVIHEQEP